MKTETCESLGVKFQVTNSPETVEEYNTAAKRPAENAVLEDAKDNVKYRGVFPVFRAKFLEAVETESGIARKTKTMTNKDGTTREEWDESERTYFNRVLSQQGVKADAFQHLADTITVAFDPSVRERAEAGPKKLPKKFLEAARELINGGHADAMAGKLSKILGRPVPSDEISLGWGIKEWDDAKSKPLANELLAA